MPQATNAVVKTGYAPVPSGTKMYYEIHGAQASRSQPPLILLHGGLGSTETVASLCSQLALARQVVTPDLPGHGRTADIDAAFSLEIFADDVSALAQHLKIEKADIFGYSLGAGTALQTTIRHPAQIRKAVLLSTVFRADGWYPEIVVAGLSAASPPTLMGSRPVSRAVNTAARSSSMPPVAPASLRA